MAVVPVRLQLGLWVSRQEPRVVFFKGIVKMKLVSKLIAQASMATLVAAMGVGAANALSVTARTVGGVNVAVTPLAFASEVVNTTDATTGDDRDDGQIVVSFRPSTGTYPSGNALVDLTLTNAGFDGAMVGSRFNFGGCTGAIVPNANVSTGGADNASTVTFVVSNLDSCGASEDAVLSIPVDVGATGNVTVTLGVRTDGGATVDGGPTTFTAITRGPAFSVSLDAGDEATADVTLPVSYDDFDPAGPTDLGSFQVVVAPAVYAALGGAGAAVLANISNVAGVTIDVSGNYDGLLAPEFGDGDQLDQDDFIVDAGVASVALTAAGDIDDLVNAIPFEVTGDTADATNVIAVSSYEATVALDLASGFTDPAAVTGTVGNIGRNGTSEVLPWTASATQAASTGSTTFVRVSNPTSQAYGAIKARVLASTNAGTVGEEAELASSLDAGAEALFTSADIEAAVGNFGRGDIEIIVEGLGSYITRLVSRPDGVYEINNRDQG